MWTDDGINVIQADRAMEADNRRDLTFRCRHLNAQGRLIIDELVAVGSSYHMALERLGLGNDCIKISLLDCVGNEREYTVLEAI